jgi:hypothetical protein
MVLVSQWGNASHSCQSQSARPQGIDYTDVRLLKNIIERGGGGGGVKHVTQTLKAPTRSRTSVFSIFCDSTSGLIPSWEK